MSRTNRSLSRRTFVKQAAVGSLAALAAPAILAAAKTDSKRAVVGVGDHQYEVDHHWAKLPAEFTWQTTHNVAVGRDGTVYVIHEGRLEQPMHPAIFAFDPEGKFIRAFGAQFQGGGHGLETRVEGNDEFVYVTAYQSKRSFAKLTPTGEVVWQTPGDKAAFSSFVVGTLGGRRQLIGYQRTTLCGFDVATGQQLWQLKPPRANDFNVPTPIVVGDKLLVTTENNGTRLYQFDAMGRIVPQPVAVNEDLAPDAHTPVVVGNRVFGVWGGLHCLDLAAGLRPLWTSDDAAFNDYATAIASDRRVLIVTMHGELILLDAAAEQFSPLSRVPLFADDPGVYSHPALVGTRMFVRGSREIICVELGEGEK